MQTITNNSELLNLKDNNMFIGTFPILENSKIVFYGKNNILFCDNDVILRDSTIEFGGDNSIIFLKRSNHKYKISIKVFNNSSIFIDRNNYFNDILHVLVSEETNLIIGRDCFFSFGIWLMTTDHHLIYDINSLERINDSKSIFIGDHVWIGQESTILKGTKIDSGAIIGANSVASGKTIENNSSYAGNPVRCIRRNVVWDGACVHKWTKSDTKTNKKYDDFLQKQPDRSVYDYIYNFEETKTIYYDRIDDFFTNCTQEEKLEYLRNLSNNNNKNRFVHSYIRKNLESDKNDLSNIEENNKSFIKRKN